MTIREYITSKFQSFGINVSDADLVDMLNDTNFFMEDECIGCAVDVSNIAMIIFIPNILLRPTSISESGFSMTWDREGIKEYYSIMCKRYGMDNELSDTPIIEFR